MKHYNSYTYLEKVLGWKNWGKHHRRLVEAIKDLLEENKRLKAELKERNKK